MLTLLIFLVILGLLIFVHEFGHFFAAKRSGAGVDEFGFGFPPRLWGIKRGETLYSINAIPLGGFVKVRGEDSETQAPGSFAALTLSKRSWVLVNGVLMNIVLAVVLFTVGFFIGTPTTLSDTDTLPAGASIRERSLTIASVIDDTPAKEAGVLPGDVVVSIDGVPTSTVSEVQTYNAARAGTVETVLVKRQKELLTFTITPRTLSDSEEKAVWGVELVETAIIRFSPLHAIVQGITTTAKLFGNIAVAFFDLIRQIFTAQKVSDDITGPIGIAVLTGRVAELGFLHLIQFTALLSLNLAFINILPFPALDGGRLVFVAIEFVSRKRISPKIERVVHSTGFALLLLLIAFITIKDFSRFGGPILKFFQGFTLAS